MFSKQRGNVVIDDLTFFQALSFIAENGCKWRALPKHFGNWNTIYCRFHYWTDTSVFDRIEKYLALRVIFAKCVKSLSIDSTYVKVHPDGVVADETLPIVRRLSSGSSADDPEGLVLMEAIPPNIRQGKPLLMDRAYEGDECRAKAKECGMYPVVPPKQNRREPWGDDKELYKRRNVVERHFRYIKELRRVFTRYDKLDKIYYAFIAFSIALSSADINTNTT